MIELKQCIYRGIMDAKTHRFPCSSPFLIVGPLGVRAEDCQKCTYCNRSSSRVPLATVEHCIHMGEPTGERIDCETCGGNVQIKVLNCKIHGECTVEKDVGKRTCLGCNDHISKDGINITHTAGGIGDVIQGLHAVAELKARNPDVHITYRVSDLGRQFASLFEGYDTLGLTPMVHSDKPVPGCRSMNMGYNDEHKASGNRIDRYCRNIGVATHRSIALRDRARIKELGTDLAGYVILCPMSTDLTRQWSLQHFATLDEMLNMRGYKTAILTQHGLKYKFTGIQVNRCNAERVVGILMNALCVVGADSGMAHLAGAVHTPSIVLGGSTEIANIFGMYPRTVCIQGELECSSCHGQPNTGWSERCLASCSNLQSITPERVMTEIDRVWLGELTRDHTLVSLDRLQVIRDCVIATNALPGVLAEFGVYKAGVAKLMLAHSHDTPLHLFDTFEGIPFDDTVGLHRAGDFKDTSIDDVGRYLDSNRVYLHPGIFPSTTRGSGDIQYRCVHVDADTYESTIDAIDYFARRMVRGGVMIFDDYGWYRCAGVMQAIHENFEEGRIKRQKGYQCVIIF